MSKSLNIETGVVEYTLNDKVSVYFNPTDLTFIEGLFLAFNDLDEKQEAYSSDIANASTNEEVFAIARRADAEMREKVDGIFQQPICDSLIGSVNIYAMSDGMPIWANLLLAIMDEIDDTYKREQEATNPRLQKYTKKFGKKS